MAETKTISPSQEKIVGSAQTKNEQKKELVILRGITTLSFSKRKEIVVLRGRTSSQINQALKAKSPYPARVFLKVDETQTDIPVFFRTKDKESWIKPKIKTGSYLEVRGYFDNPKNGSSRKSFTAYSYQILENHD